jgi:predicted house-cleaning noncanonical NTP pyrophosphatase (MazG superfamily)
MPIYNKLVRDKIPEIIKNSGKNFIMKILNDDEYIKALQQKSYEELEEFIHSKTIEQSIEELADMLEIIHALADYHDVSFDYIDECRKKKLQERGGFKKRICLIKVDH